MFASRDLAPGAELDVNVPLKVRAAVGARRADCGERREHPIDERPQLGRLEGAEEGEELPEAAGRHFSWSYSCRLQVEFSIYGDHRVCFGGLSSLKWCLHSLLSVFNRSITVFDHF